MRHWFCIAAVCAVAGLSTVPATAATIYRHEFSGSGGPLHDALATVDNYQGGGNRWIARTNDGTPTGTGIVFYDNGSIVGSEALAGATFGNATLPFVPQPGNVYTLDVSLGGVTVPDGNANWVGVGFAAGSTTTGNTNGDRFIGPGGSIGQPWMIYRGTGAPAAQLDQTFLGPGTMGGVNWATPVVASRGAAVDLRIVLDTRPALWEADWFAKNPGDAAYTLLREEAYATNPTIGAVGYAIANNNVGGTIVSVELSVVPEPASVGLLVAGLVAVSMGCRKRLF
jgi:hypothetical protein